MGTDMALFRERYPALFAAMPLVVEPAYYSGMRNSADGIPIPLTRQGRLLHSAYNAEREAAKFIDDLPSDGYVVFIGLGSACHIREFRRRFPKRRCAVLEINPTALAELFQLNNMDDLILDRDLLILTPDGSGSLSFSAHYYPALDGQFICAPLRSFSEAFPEEYSALTDALNVYLNSLTADYSVQAHFGRIWLRNILENLYLLSGTDHIHGEQTSLSREQAVILAAGPSLEAGIPALLRDRERLCLFSTDTAYPVLKERGIIPDYLVSIDAQAVSAHHVHNGMAPQTTLILDICGNPGLAHAARQSGSPVIFTAGTHPLARSALSFGSLRTLDSSGGTVTLAALCAAMQCGFSRIRIFGADFCYPAGKCYSRGTYLQSIFDGCQNRYRPLENSYSALLFRAPVRRVDDGIQFQYRTEILDRYEQSFIAVARHHGFTMRFQDGARVLENSAAVTGPYGGLWREYEGKSGFEFDSFISELTAQWRLALNAFDRDNPWHVCLLPFMAWAGQKQRDNPIQLALDMIAGYTEKS